MLAIVPPWRIFKRFFSRHELSGRSITGHVTHGMLFLNIKLELDASRNGRGDAELMTVTLAINAQLP
jgi:hypothetical protein